jgi:hypothetical protein
MPDPVPVMVIGRLAIAVKFQGHGIGPALLRDAVLRNSASRRDRGNSRDLDTCDFGVRKRFYEIWDFIPSPVDPMTLMVTVKEAAKTFAEKPTNSADRI